VLETRRLVAPIKLDESDVPNILKSLRERGWTPAVLQSQLEFLRLSGLEDSVSPAALLQSERNFPGRHGVYGDIVFRDAEVYFLLTRDEEPTLEVGIISTDTGKVEEHLDEFKDCLQDAIMTTLDGRKTRHMKFNWMKPPDRLSRIGAQRAQEEETGEVRFQPAKISAELIQGAELLAEKPARSILQELSQAGFAREIDIVSRRSRKDEEIKGILDRLKGANLVNTEFLLVCRRTRTPITRLREGDRLKSEHVGTLICPSCGAAFKDENLTEGYTLSELGRHLSQGSHWMTVWVTKRLVDSGVPQESILWNLEESGEEVDLIVGVLNELWIFELKDREFGSGDAHPFNYRRVRYRAQKAIVITTEQVSADAKRVFQELVREAGRSSSLRTVRTPSGGLRRVHTPGIQPLFIEGLENVSPTLETEVAGAAWRSAAERLSLLGEITGFDLSGVVARKFNQAPVPIFT